MGLHIKNGVHYGSGPNKASQLSIVDTEGIIGNAGSTVTTQALVDGIADDLKESEVVPSKNLLENPNISKTIDGIQFTVNPDGTVLANRIGTSTGTVTLGIGRLPSKYIGKTVKAVGCPAGGSPTTYEFSDNGGVNRDRGEGVTFTYNNEYFQIAVRQAEPCNNVLFKPMITEDTSVTYADYEPYKKSIKDQLKEYEVIESDNYLPNEIKSNVEFRGITFSVNSKDKSITANGTATSNVYFRIASSFTVPKTGTYKLLGTPPDATGRRELYVFPESTGVAVIADLDGNGATGELTAGVLYAASIYIANGVTLSDKVYKPMLTTELNATYNDYESYYLPVKDAMLTCDANAALGAHQLLYRRSNLAQTVAGLVVTPNSDGSFSVGAGTATSSGVFLISGSGSGSWSQAEQTLPIGEYYASCEGATSGVYFRVTAEPVTGASQREIYAIDGSADYSISCPLPRRIVARIEIATGAVVPAGGITLKPLIRLKSDNSREIAPYTKTNQELTDEIKITTYTKTTDGTGECSIGSDSAYVPIGGSIVGTQNTHYGAISFRTESNDRNAYYAMFYSATSSALNVVANKELTFIVVWVKKA